VIPTPALPRFELHRFLGRGALGDVYFARDRETSRDVALKLVRMAAIPPDMLAAEKNGALLQQRLAEVAPQVPAIFHFGEENGTFWISMEYVDGVDLDTAIDRGPFPETRAVGIAIELCKFLDELHGFRGTIGGRLIQGVVHGDIKPQNLRLQAADRLRVLDFGIARQLSVSRSFTHQPFGSLPYISPERLDTGVVDRLADLWSVGVLLSTMLAGRLPFDGSTPADLENNLRRGLRRPLPDSCPAALRAILGRCLHPEASHRYPSAAALKEDLEAFQEGRLVVPAIQETRHGTRRTTPPVNEAPPVASAPGAGTIRGKAGGWAAILLGLVATFGACQGYVAMESRHLRRELESASGSEVGALSRRYLDLRRVDLLNLTPAELGPEVKAALLRTADGSLNRDPEDLPSSRQQWEGLRGDLNAALEIDPADLRTRARLAYSRAQVELAEAAGFQENGEVEAATHSRENALAALGEAARLDDTWPQPHVLRARIYLESSPIDLKRLEASLAAAEERGYPKARLILYRADGYHAEGQRLYSEAIRERGGSQERSLLESAIERFSQAIDLYGQVPESTRARSAQEADRRTRSLLENRYIGLPLPW